jgi:hypothetical protein
MAQWWFHYGWCVLLLLGITICGGLLLLLHFLPPTERLLVRLLLALLERLQVLVAHVPDPEDHNPGQPIAEETAQQDTTECIRRSEHSPDMQEPEYVHGYRGVSNVNRPHSYRHEKGSPERAADCRHQTQRRYQRHPYAPRRRSDCQIPRYQSKKEGENR